MTVGGSHPAARLCSNNATFSTELLGHIIMLLRLQLVETHLAPCVRYVPVAAKKCGVSASECLFLQMSRNSLDYGRQVIHLHTF